MRQAICRLLLNKKHNQMAKTDYKTINEYHQAFSTAIQERMQSLRCIIFETMPQVEESISYQIPTFKYKGVLIHYAAAAKHISLLYPWSETFLKKFEKELKALKVSRSAIQFPNKEALPVGFIKQIVAFRKKENETLVAKSKK